MASRFEEEEDPERNHHLLREHDRTEILEAGDSRTTVQEVKHEGIAPVITLSFLRSSSREWGGSAPGRSVRRE